MGLFDFLKDNEDEQDPTAVRARIGQAAQPTEPTAATPDATVPNVKDYITQKFGLTGPPVSAATPSAQYKEISNDTSAVDAAKSEADAKKSKASVLEGLSQMFGGQRAGDSAYYAGLRNNADKAVTAAQADKQQKLNSLITGSKLQESDRANDPDSATATATRGIIAKQYNVDPASLAGMNYSEMVQVAKQLKSGAKGAGSFQQSNIEVPGKGTFKAVFDPATGKYQMTPYHAGYKLGFDPTTGQMVSGSDPTASASQVVAANGQPLADLRTQLGETRAYGNSAAIQQQKNDETAKVDAAGGRHIDQVSKDLSDLYNKAKDETVMTGPFMGHVGEGIHKAGISTGEASDKFDTESSREMLDYAHKTFGSRITEYDLSFINKVSPTLHDSPQMVQDKLKAFKDWSDRKKAESADIAGRPPATTTQQQSTPADQAAMKWLQDNPNDPAAAKVRAKLQQKGLL